MKTNSQQKTITLPITSILQKWSTLKHEKTVDIEEESFIFDEKIKE